MKDYRITKIRACEISALCEIIESRIESKQNRIETYKNQLKEIEDKKGDWRCESIEEAKEEIKALEWALNLLNAPFKIKK